MRVLLMFAVLLLAAPMFAAPIREGKKDDTELTPEQARKKIGDPIVLKMKVEASKDRLEKLGEIFLDASKKFRDDKNFAVVISAKGAESLKAAGIADPAAHFLKKTIRAEGTPRIFDNIPRIDIHDAKQIRVVD